MVCTIYDKVGCIKFQFNLILLNLEKNDRYGGLRWDLMRFTVINVSQNIIYIFN